MPRKQFIADLTKARTDARPLGISDVETGDDDGMFNFVFTNASGDSFSVTAMVQPDLSEYPKSHDYMLFCADNTPQHISTAVQNVRGKDRKTVFELLDIVSAALSRVNPDRDGDSQMPDSQYDEEEEEQFDGDQDVYNSDHEAFDIVTPSHNATYAPSSDSSSSRAFRQRIRSDLRVAKEAGFKVGHLGQLLNGTNSYVTVSIRVAKLGISEEAMQAWQVEAADYLTIIIQYPNGYKTNEELQGLNSHHLSSNLCMRVVAGKRYKPTLQEAIRAFTIARRDAPTSTSLPAPDAAASPGSSIRDTFISKPLAKMLQERLVPILRFRGLGMDWAGAEGWYQEMSSAGATNQNNIPDKYFEPEKPDEKSALLPAIMMADHHSNRSANSFPLLAMQFMLRHFVRCTSFCLVCHRKLTSDFEAIKPYVCDRGLCLFQLLSLGFGPSIEHEVMAQPYVVDLLVSFCYVSAAARRLKSFPDGLGLMVPPVDTSNYNVSDPMTAYRIRQYPAIPAPTVAQPKEYPKYEVGFVQTKLEIIFFNKTTNGCPSTVRRGTWIVLNCEAQKNIDLHCRVAETSFFPTISIDTPIKVCQQRDAVTPAAPQTPAATRPVSPASPQWEAATFQVYEQNFEELDHGDKCVAICRLLETVPSVTDMRDYLTARHPAELSNWTERVPPHALSLLRWIVASNRSCIMQVDGDQDGGSASRAKSERCYGMKGQMQFRFAMGAPDKEQRFVTAVRDTTTRLKLKYPTLFAWHGSPLANWHMIIREGLNFDKADHGRAFGDGVYHSQDALTSTGYSNMHLGYNPGGMIRQGMWPGSVLNISAAMALNEIVNAPQEYTSSSPHLVVQQLEWIQTRYLFVQVSPSVETLKIPEVEQKPVDAHVQDPARTPNGMTRGEKIVIPAAAIKSGKATPTAEPPLKKLKRFGNQSNPVVIEDDAMSIATDAEDLDILFDEPVESTLVSSAHVSKCAEPASASAASGSQAVKTDEGPKTDFVPGTLDFSNLPLMPVPHYASTATTRHLMQELQKLHKIQCSTPLAELGWYIDAEKIENVYQWVVELHSFHTFSTKGKQLPLSEDMLKRKITSIVLEVNFNKDFPFTPPYVRVIRPRFLSFLQGGGGHIVMGGAMCMELLTNTGWSVASTMESVLMQVRMAIASEPHARLELRDGVDYGTGEAADGYLRACQTHGWQVPPGFREMAYGNTQGQRG